MNSLKHLVFYDGSCGLCDRIVGLLLDADRGGLFAFAPLSGSTAKKNLPPGYSENKNPDSLIFIENFQTPRPQIYIKAKAALRIAWLLGGPWKLAGCLFFIPAFFSDPVYNLIARNRRRFFSADRCRVDRSGFNERFFP